MADTNYDADRRRGKGRGFFEPAKVAVASAAAAAAIHGDDDGGFLEDLVRASLQGELDRITSTNEVRKRYGLPTIDDVWIGAILHDCAPDFHKPWHNPDKNRFGGYWECNNDGRGCFNCQWIEYDLELVE